MQTNSESKSKPNSYKVIEKKGHKLSDKQTVNQTNCLNQTFSSKLRINIRPTKHLCAERLACKGVRPEAQFLCRECKSYQCQLCEELLHEKSQLESHDRQRLPVFAEELICQNSCQTKNLSDIYCIDCNKSYCFVCDQSLHSSPNKRRHQKKPFEQNQTQLEDESSEEFFSCPPVTNGTTESEATESLINVDLDSSSDDNKELLRSEYNETHHKNQINHRKSGSLRLPDIAQLPIERPLNGPTVSSSTGTGVVVMHSNTSESDNRQSFLLIDENELLKVTSSDEFATKIGCCPTELIKVVSIFGNTGEGKSHTLNYTFFNGREMFKTSANQTTGTIGIWCAFDPKCKVITIDTEGLLGIAENTNRRTRLLLKVLAISDVIIYRTRAERLHEDLFTFLDYASRAYVQHFSKELKAATQRCKLSCPPSDLGPTVIIFHETLHTEILSTDNDLTPEDYLRQRFQRSDLSTEAFSAFEYVGTQTITPPTDFHNLRETVKKHLKNSTVRSSRTSSVVFTALKLLNEKFSGNIEKPVLTGFFDEFFTCPSHCLSCNTRCTNSMNHWRDGQCHSSLSKCKYQHQFNNQIFICRACNDRGESNIVLPKAGATGDSTWVGIARYAWSGYILECKFCGVIYRSRQYWYGNKEPTEESVVRTEIQHVWPDEPMPSQGSQNVGQKAIDTFGYLTTTASQITAKPSKMVADWVADKIAPSYWVPNNRLVHCGGCEKEFGALDQKHHCRSCGGGFCENCSTKSRPVPERGWGDQPVRVCDSCFEKGERAAELANPEVTARLVGEMFQSTIGTVVSAIDYPLEWIKESARPDYWVPDKDISNCLVCKTEFNEKIAIHHCRSCGQGVCDECSQTRMPVPSRGWDQPVRTCDECQQKLGSSKCRLKTI